MNTIKFKESEKDALMWLFWKGMEITKSNKKYDIFDRLYQEISNTKSERHKSTETSDKHETKQLNILGVMRSFSKQNMISVLMDRKNHFKPKEYYKRERERLTQAINTIKKLVPDF